MLAIIYLYFIDLTAQRYKMHGNGIYIGTDFIGKSSYKGMPEETWKKVKLIARTMPAEQALRSIDCLVYQYPFDFRIYCIISLLHQKLKDYNTAINELKLAEQIEPNNVYIKYSLTLLYLKSHQQQKFMETAEKIKYTKIPHLHSRIVSLPNGATQDSTYVA